MSKNLNNKKIAFILCINNELYYQECCYYIQNLIIPEGFEIDIIAVREAESMTSGYNAAMKSSDAKYKIYLHQDLFLIRKDFITQLLEVFSNPEIGMVGLLGTDQAFKHAHFAACWDKGTIIHSNFLTVFKTVFKSKHYEDSQTVSCPVKFIDGVLIATQYDIPWDEIHYDKWDFYDISQCKQFSDQGYRIAVFNTNESFGYHDIGFCSFKLYDKYRKFFCENNAGFQYEELRTNYYIPDEINEVNEAMIKAIESRLFDIPFQIRDVYKNDTIFDNTYSYILFYLNILEKEVKKYKTPPLLKLECFQDFIETYNQIKFYMLRIDFGIDTNEAQIIANLIKEDAISIALIEEIIQHSCVNQEKVADAITENLSGS